VTALCHSDPVAPEASEALAHVDALRQLIDETILDNPNNMIVGSTYDVETINGISWLMKNKGRKAGDTIGHIYLQGEYGEDSYLGSQYATKQAGLKLEGAQITATATDLTSRVASMKSRASRRSSSRRHRPRRRRRRRSTRRPA